MNHDPRRRVVLRGALATGYLLGIPLILGCGADTPPQPPDTAGPPPDTPAEAATQTEPAAPGTPSSVAGGIAKLSQEEAHYQDEPNNDQRCSECLHFVAASNTCKVVEGEVSPDGWCMLWTRRT
jgi:hypothetical protein